MKFLMDLAIGATNFIQAPSANFGQAEAPGGGSTNTSTSTNQTGLTEIATTLANLMKKLVGPILIVIGAAAAIYAIYLGVMYAKAEDANKRKEVQGRLIGAAIGVVIILVGITLCYAINWATLVDNWNS